MGKSSIEWTDVTWNPTVGCTKVTAGCTHCYAEVMDRRLVARNEGIDFVPWTVHAQNQPVLKEATAAVRVYTDAPTVRLHHERLDQPLRWKKPVRVFVDSMSDLFHEDVPDEFIRDVWWTMKRTPQHTYQILTKRPDRAARWYATEDPTAEHVLPNVWIGVSVTGGKETAPFLDALARIPAAVRFVSYEPALRPFDFSPWLTDEQWCPTHAAAGDSTVIHEPGCEYIPRAIDWLIVGGESGPKARPFNLLWASDVAEQCRTAGVACFVKQLGSIPVYDACRRYDMDWHPTLRYMGWRPGLERALLNDRKGGDWSEWPEALRVREFPTTDHFVGTGEKVGR